MKQRLRRDDVVMMLADMTNPNAFYDEVLHAFDSAGIPYNLMVPPSGSVIEFPTVVTQGVMNEALDASASR